jgi:pimeloyl-ACP methyl ester carboxylesterase
MSALTSDIPALNQGQVKGTIRTLVFIHGFLDSNAAWTPLIDALSPYGLQGIAPDLRGAGERAAQDGPFTLAQAVEDVVELLRVLAPPAGMALIGHSMGAQIAELVAARIPGKTSALVLLTPTPLEGNVLPGDIREMLRESGGDVAAQRGIRQLFSRNLPEDVLRRSLDPRHIMSKAAVRGYYDAFSDGDRAGEQPSRFEGPTLILGAADDPVIPPDMLRQIRARRHARAELAFIDGSGHWPQAEQAQRTAAHLAEFLKLGV